MPLVLSNAAHAAGFDLDFFKPTTMATGTFNEENGLTVGRGRLETDVAGTYAYRPLVLRVAQTAGNTGDVVRDRVTGYVAAAFGITNNVDFAIRLSAVLRQLGKVDADFSDGGVPQRPRLAGPGDTDIIMRIALVTINPGDRLFRLTLTAPVGIPTGATDALAGNGRISFRPRLTAGWHRDAFAIAVSTGLVLRSQVEIPLSGLVVGSAITGGAGFSWAAVQDRLWLLTEVSALVGVGGTTTGITNAPAQAMCGPRVRLPADFLLQAGAGTGLNNTAGSPRFAAAATVGRVW